MKTSCPLHIARDSTDPRSKGIDRLITSEPTLDLGSVRRGSRYFYLASYPGSLIALIPDLETFGEFEILPEG